MTRPPLPLVLVAGLLGAGVLVGGLIGPGSGAGVSPAAAAGPRTVPVVATESVCPDVRQRPGVLVSRVSAGSAPAAVPPVPGGGRVATLPLTAAARVPAQVPLPGPAVVADGLGGRLIDGGLVVSARGPLAAGLEVEVVARGVSGVDRGLSGVRCGPATTDAWFLGGSTRVGSAAVLVVANPDDTPATLDVTVWSAAGPVDSRPGQGLVVPPRGRLAVRLDTLAPDRDLLAMHLRTERGRVAAALRSTRRSGVIPLGVDMVPVAPAPAREVVLPGVPAGPGTRRLLLANPGQDDATAAVELTSGDGQFVPSGLSDVRVPAGHSVAVDLTAQVAAGPAAVRVTADAPLLAAADVADSQGTPVQDLAYAGAGGPLAGPALLTDLVLDRPTQSTLLLSALDTDARVVVTPIPVLGMPGALPAPRTVLVAGGRTTALKLSTLFPPGASARLAVLVAPAPGSGPVYAARYLRERGASGPLSTMLLLRGSTPEVSRPVVAPDLAPG